MTDDASPENLRKFLESDDPAMVRMGIAMAKGAGVEVHLHDLTRFLGSDDAISDDIETIKTGLMLADEAGHVDDAMTRLCGILEAECECAQDWYCALGHAHAYEVAFRENESFHDEIHPVRIVEAIIQFGSKKAKEPLLVALDSGIESQNWWLPGLAAEALTSLGWKPETNEQKASYLIATKDWEECKETGEPLVTKAVLYLAEPVRVYCDSTGIFDRVMEAVNSFGETTVVAGWLNSSEHDRSGYPANEYYEEALAVLGHEVE